MEEGAKIEKAFAAAKRRKSRKRDLAHEGDLKATYHNEVVFEEGSDFDDCEIGPEVDIPDLMISNMPAPTSDFPLIKCSICHYLILPNALCVQMSMECTHSTHIHCAKNWFRVKANCPECRRPAPI
jgi:hypothetical protein